MDVVQDAFIKAFDSLQNFQRESSFRTWLMRIAANRSLDVLRARKIRKTASLDADENAVAEPPDSRAASAESRLELEESAAAIQAAVEDLPPDQRAVFSLYATGEMTYAQIAEAVGVPVGTVMSRLFHARRKLKAALGWLDEASQPASKEVREAGKRGSVGGSGV